MSNWNNIPVKAITDDGMARILVSLNISKSENLTNKPNSLDVYPEVYNENFTKNNEVPEQNIDDTITALLNRLPKNEYRLYRRYRFVPMIAMEVTQKAYSVLTGAPEVNVIYADLPEPLPIYQ